jgi:hypothetical protein
LKPPVELSGPLKSLLDFFKDCCNPFQVMDDAVLEEAVLALEGFSKLVRAWVGSTSGGRSQLRSKA